jgi:hypothetical protein
VAELVGAVIGLALMTWLLRSSADVSRARP